jgi:hypothetical protein
VANRGVIKEKKKKEKEEERGRKGGEAPLH